MNLTKHNTVEHWQTVSLIAECYRDWRAVAREERRARHRLQEVTLAAGCRKLNPCRNAVIGLMLLVVTSSAQLTTPKATPTADKPMVRPVALRQVAPPMPTASLVDLPSQTQTVSVGIAWDRSESEGVTYRVYSTDASGVVTGFGDVGDVTTYRINGLTNGPWKLQVTAANGVSESAPATLMFYNEKVFEYYGQTAPTLDGRWTDLTLQPFWVITNPTSPAEFTRIRVHPRRR